MFGLMVQWLLSAIALMLVARVVPGFEVEGFLPALLASVAIGLLNATLGALLKILTFPFVIVTFGLFLLVINGLMILLASKLVPGFHVEGVAPAIWGAAVLAVLGLLIRAFTKND